MRKVNQRAFRPAVESIEERVAASSGLATPAHVVPATAKAHAAPKPKPHAAPKPKPHAAPKPTPPPEATAPAQAPPPVARVSTGASTQAWVRLVNMTGQDLQYKLSLGNYQDGKFLAFDIAGQGNNSAQYRMSSVTAKGQSGKSSFAIRFDDGPITTLNTGISAQAARGYYIFADTSGQYYISPILTS